MLTFAQTTAPLPGRQTAKRVCLQKVQEHGLNMEYWPGREASVSQDGLLRRAETC